jgi:multicomponent Na+:H+ antiporter subunit E
MTASPKVPSAAAAAPAVNRFLFRMALMALLWLGLNGAVGSSWIVGGPVTLAGAWLSLKLLPAASWHWSLRGAVAFAWFFLRESLRGGWDVAWRALSPGLRLSPGIVCHPLRLPAGPARMLFASTVSLLPGTAVVAIEDHQLRVHALDLSPRVETELRRLESRVAALFDLDLTGATEAAS